MDLWRGERHKLTGTAGALCILPKCVITTSCRENKHTPKPPSCPAQGLEERGRTKKLHIPCTATRTQSSFLLHGHAICMNFTLPRFNINALEPGSFLQPKFYFLLHPNSFCPFRNGRLAAPYQGQAGEQSWVHSHTSG